MFCINCENFIRLSEVDSHSTSDCHAKKKHQFFGKNTSNNNNRDEGEDINEVLRDLNEKLGYVAECVEKRA